MEIGVYNSDMRKRYAKARSDGRLHIRDIRFHMFKFLVRIAIRIAGSATYHDGDLYEHISVSR